MTGSGKIVSMIKDSSFIANCISKTGTDEKEISEVRGVAGAIAYPEIRGNSFQCSTPAHNLTKSKLTQHNSCQPERVDSISHPHG